MTKKQQTYTKGYYSRYCKGSFASYEDFMNHIGQPPKTNMLLSLKCVSKGYTSGNIFWAVHPNRKSRYLVKTLNGNTASLKSACEQDGVKYGRVYTTITAYNLQDSLQAAYAFGKMDMNARRAFRRNAVATAIKNLS
jgi:hypothetical protein